MCPALAEGLQAYAQEQSDIQTDLLNLWHMIFAAPLTDGDKTEDDNDKDGEMAGVGDNGDEGDNGDDDKGGMVTGAGG